MFIINEIFKILRLWLKKTIISRRMLFKNKVHTLSIIPQNVSVGAYTFIAENVVIGPATNSIGSFCSIASGVIIGPNSHNIKYITTSSKPFTISSSLDLFKKRSIESEVKYRRIKDILNSQKTVIQDDVWIGHNAIIMPGVQLGVGAVVGAGAVVTKNVEPYTIVGGIPAKVISPRFTDNCIQKLLKADIYKYDHETLIKLFNKYSEVNLEDCINELLDELKNT